MLPIFTPAQPACVEPGSQNFVDGSSISNDNVTAADEGSQAQTDTQINAPRNKFGTSAMLAIFTILGIIVLVIAVWAFIAHRDGRRPSVCFGSCTGCRGNAGDARSSNMEPTGAGRHYDHRHVWTQAQPIPMPTPQYPQATLYVIPRRPLPQPEWLVYSRVRRDLSIRVSKLINNTYEMNSISCNQWY
ncbi:hypothetical protein SVAN01_11218 [Stagonosporopsis vannaccii]|nr:hypothetical protein SVAN01_11218 [Stagonosporopsis vannaccii]